MAELAEHQLLLGVVADHGGVGFGHVARCLAVMQEWILRGGTSSLLSDSALPGSWGRRLREAGAEVLPMAELRSLSVDVWLIDGYRFGPALCREMRSRAPLAVIDDFGTSGCAEADLVIDQNLGASAVHYSASHPGARLLLGTDYALLRREIVDAIPSEAPDRRTLPQRLLVSLGGEPTPTARHLITRVEHGISNLGLEVERLEDVDDVSQPMRRADVALSAAGATCWELCAFGIPSVVIALAPNQEPLARELGRAGAVIDGGDIASVSDDAIVNGLRLLCSNPEARASQAAAGRRLVDGNGGSRVVLELLSLVNRKLGASAD